MIKNMQKTILTLNIWLLTECLFVDNQVWCFQLVNCALFQDLMNSLYSMLDHMRNYHDAIFAGQMFFVKISIIFYFPKK